MALTYPKKYENDINLDIQNRAIINFANTEQKNLNGFLLHRMAHYKVSEYDDTMLWYYIKEDFVRQIKETQVPINKDIIWDFRNFLQEYGVFVPINGGVIKNNIQKHVINTKKKHEWTPQEIKHQLHTIKKFNSRWNPNTTPQQKQVQDPFASQFNNLQTPPTRPTSPLQPEMQLPPPQS